MNIAIIKENTCINVAVFGDLQTAQGFLAAGVWPDADTIAELPEGYGIGDFYNDGVWEKKPAPEPEPEDMPALRTAKKTEIGAACTETIYAGVEVDGKRYALTEHDQTEIMAQLSSVQAGAPAVPYHADGELCRMYTAAEFTAIANAAMAYIFYHRTYCNHMNAWINRAELAELDAIIYGAQLPEDLAQHMAALLAEAGGGA